MRAVLCVRHGESQWNADGRWQGWIDIDLTPRGEEQARARGRVLAAEGVRFGAIYCSDLVRARRTAELIAGELGGPDPIPDPGFRERHGGAFQGLVSREIAEQHGDAFAAWRAGTLDAPPGGESTAEVFARFDRALGAAAHAAPPGPLLVVTHGGVLRMVAMRAGVDSALTARVLENASGLWFDHDGETLSARADAVVGAIAVDAVE